MTPEREALLPVLGDLSAACEELVSTGLSAATGATVAKLDAAFQEAARKKLGRLAASLRYTTDELGRHVARSEEFSASRLVLFLHRSWMIAEGLRRAIRTGDEATWQRLVGGAGTAPVALPSVTAVVLGVAKRASRTSGAFEFRMREWGGDRHGQPLVWSFVFARKSSDLPVEAWLHLPQPQKFEPRTLLQPGPVTFTQVAIGGGRLQLGPKATVTVGATPVDLGPFVGFDRRVAADRVRAWTVSPLDLEVELQEEAWLEGYSLGEPTDRDGARIWPIAWQGLTLEARVPPGEEGAELEKNLRALQQAKSPPAMFGLLHYAACRFEWSPLSVLEHGKIRSLVIGSTTIDKKKLLALLSL